ncbi:MAG: 50S ribosomal protein L5 [Armatimonadetes bacterium]|nr:50S ribosomal protein L5 [Armatimonadota bacterium]
MIARQVESRLRKQYVETIAPAVMEKFGLRNPHELPRITKIIVNCGIGRFLENQKLKPEVRDTVTTTLATITGQRPIIVKAKKSVSNFKVREGMKIGCHVTLRGDRMWHFLDRLCTVALPRLRDFQGLSRRSFDGRGNFTIGLKEQLVFTEIDYDTFDKIRGMDVTIVTTARNDEEGAVLLKGLGLPLQDK